MQSRKRFPFTGLARFPVSPTSFPRSILYRILYHPQTRRSSFDENPGFSRFSRHSKISTGRRDECTVDPSLRRPECGHGTIQSCARSVKHIERSCSSLVWGTKMAAVDRRAGDVDLREIDLHRLIFGSFRVRLRQFWKI